MIVHLITEGHLEEFIGKRLIEHCGHSLGEHYSMDGSGNVLKKAHKYMPLVQTGARVLVLTDFRDARCPCPPAACVKYLNGKAGHPDFLLRFAEQEIESWLLADAQNLADFLKIPDNKVPPQPELEVKPKQTLVNLARKSKKKHIKQGLVPSEGGGVGLAYNSLLTEFVEEHWDIARAMENAPSLARCIIRLG